MNISVDWSVRGIGIMVVGDMANLSLLWITIVITHPSDQKKTLWH